MLLLMVNELESEELQRTVLCAMYVSDMGVSAVGLCSLDADGYPQKYPQSNKINHLRPRRFGAGELNRTRVRTWDSKWQTRGQLHTRE